MRTPIILLVTFLICTGSKISYSQFDCSGDRYNLEVFTSYNLTSDILYGQNINRLGNIEDLYLDIYEPTGDTATIRPLIILVHGGSFISGDKTGCIADLCKELTKYGYVTASINYRIGMDGFPVPGPDSIGATEAVLRATHDARAAVRFFRKDFIENGKNKLEAKNLDMIIVNTKTLDNDPFGEGKKSYIIINREGLVERFETIEKTTMAREIIEKAGILVQ